MSDQNSSYNKYLKEFGRNLRNNSTHAEISLWSNVLRASKVGVPFRRQRPIDRYIVDFVCLKLKLVIELDGETHIEPDDIERDQRRQKRLELLGFQVLRFRNEEVFEELERVEEVIRNKIEELSSP